ncbi:MAG: nuclear transport factor 2 family protein [Caldilineaceae bacterium]
MLRFTLHRLLIVALLALFALSACQPIRPEATKATKECTDADKIALARAYEAGFQKGDANTLVALFTDDGVLAFDPSPHLDRTTGKYKAPPVIHVEGHEAIKNLIDVIFSLHGGVVYDSLRVQEDMVVALGNQVSPMSPIFGTPGDKMGGTMIFLIRDCKIATARFVISQAALDAMSTEAAAVGAKCEDKYKSAVFQRFVMGLWNGDLDLATVPWAEDAVLRFDGLPRFDAATQAYVIDPAVEQKATGLPQIQDLLKTMIAQQTGITLTLETQQIKGATLTISDTTTQFNPSPEFKALPLPELAGIYTATFNKRCDIATLDHVYPQATLKKLTEAKARK